MQKNNVFKLAIIFLLTLVVSTATVIPAANVRANANANEQQENISKVVYNDTNKSSYCKLFYR
ncbi:hypothetical protein [Apilactobacillus kunkeei]|uniref:Uncharacterized protein n=1 Tax=Apilactobacillus kunkeei TaxID=148814 RepID=A0A1L8CJC4_9LACO|nr:hypothetical protein [Apilactobacillus kunkeei]GAT91313.1 hypothetical protein FF306_01435 [Apilactobacillus kunkeei]